MTDPAYAVLRVSLADGVARVTIDNPPVNVLDVRLMGELRRFLASVRDDEAVKVIVLDSAAPDPFVAHVDMTLVDDPRGAKLARSAPEGLNVFQALDETMRS